VTVPFFVFVFNFSVLVFLLCTLLPHLLTLWLWSAAVMSMPVIRSEPSDLSDGSDLSSLSHLFFYYFFSLFTPLFFIPFTHLFTQTFFSKKITKIFLPHCYLFIYFLSSFIYLFCFTLLFYFSFHLIVVFTFLVIFFIIILVCNLGSNVIYFYFLSFTFMQDFRMYLGPM